MGCFRLHELPSTERIEAPPRALVLILFTAGKGAEQALAFAPRWRQSAPQAAFVGIELDTAVVRTEIAALPRAAAAAATARSIRPSQIVLVGAGVAGRLAVDLVLQRAIPATGVIGLDIPPSPAPSAIVPTLAKVRLVQHRTDEDPHAINLRALVDAMQRQDVDVRSMILPDAAHDAPGVTLRACGSFLVELVANASCLPRGSSSRR